MESTTSSSVSRVITIWWTAGQNMMQLFLGRVVIKVACIQNLLIFMQFHSFLRAYL